MTNLTKAAKPSCCGTYSKRKRAIAIESNPDNPSISNGIDVIYVGSGYKSIASISSGYTYHCSDHHRHFTIAVQDVDQVMKNKDIIYKP